MSENSEVRQGVGWTAGEAGELGGQAEVVEDAADDAALGDGADDAQATVAAGARTCEGIKSVNPREKR